MKSQDFGMLVFLAVLLVLPPVAKLSGVIFIACANLYRRLRHKRNTQRNGNVGGGDYVLRPF